jgi:hypothetical protein
MSDLRLQGNDDVVVNLGRLFAEACDPDGFADRLRMVLRRAGAVPVFGLDPPLVRDVEEFNEKFGVPRRATPGFTDAVMMGFRHGFLDEERRELGEAYAAGDLVKYLDALCDLVYVAIGTAVICGLPYREAWRAVQRANLAKRLKSELSQPGRHPSDVGKPAGWVPPEGAIRAALLAAGWDEPPRHGDVDPRDEAAPMSGQSGWIGVDLDGTLARYDGWVSAAHVGEPVPAMLARVKAWLAEGRCVKVFTARVYSDGTPSRNEETVRARRAIDAWCLEHVGRVLEVTCVKDYAMFELWDDRAVGVRKNVGVPEPEATLAVVVNALRDEPRALAKLQAALSGALSDAALAAALADTGAAP